MKIKTKLSVNINKIATLRNARGGNLPDVLLFTKKALQYGAEGITVHPRPDERHIRYDDVRKLRPIIKKEFNIEGNPTLDKFVNLVLQVRPDQVTLVPDSPKQITSNHGWDCKKNLNFLTDIIHTFKKKNIRTSIFLDPDIRQIEYAKRTGTDRVELYTESYALNFVQNKKMAIRPYHEMALEAQKIGLGLNAGHDLNLQNLHYYIKHIPYTLEVSIGHALIADALYFGLQETIKKYKKQIRL